MDSEHIQHWRDDLHYLATQLREHHANPYHTITSVQLDDIVASLHDRIPDLPPHTIIVEMSRIVASIGDGHTSFWLDSNTSLNFQRYPLRFYRFRDGIAVYETDADHRFCLGARLKSIGDYNAEDVLAQIEKVVSGDNIFMRQQKACAALNIPEVLHALNIIPNLDAAEFILEDADGKSFTVKPPTLQPDSIQWINLADNETPLALWRQHPDRFYWFEYIEAHQLAYLNHRVVRDAADETIADFCARLFDFIDTHPVEKLVIDLRANSGGNNMLNQALIHGLICCRKVNQTGKLFTIVGGQTFSAAMNLAVDLERNTKTLFVGEPTGASPNHYGEIFNVTLPNSKIGLTLSMWYWQSSMPNDKRGWIEPQIPMQISSTDYWDNIDPLLEAIIAYPSG